MGHAAGDFNQTLDTTEGLGEGEELSGLAEALGGIVTAADAEGKHTTSHAVAVLLDGEVAMGVRVEAGVVDGDDVRRSLEGVGDGGGILGGFTGTEVEGLEASVGEPRVKGGRDGADGVLEEAEALLEVIAVESGDTHDDVAVAVDVLGDTVDDDVGAEVERVLDIRREESVVNDDEDAVLVSNGDDSSNVDQAQSRVAGRLDPDQTSLLSNVLCDVDLNLGSEGDLDSVSLGHLCEVTVSSTVDVRDGDDMAASGQTLENGSSGGTAAGEGESIAGVFQSGNGRLEVQTVGVGRSGVLKIANRLANGGLSECCGERNGLDDGASGRVMWCAGLDSECSKGVDRSRRPSGRRDGV